MKFTVEDGMASEQAHLVLKLLLPLSTVCISAISDPAVGLH